MLFSIGSCEVVYGLLRFKSLLKSDRAESSYISTTIYIFVAVIILAFIINVLSIISAKQQMDYCADQLVKQIQLSGGISSDTDDLFDFLQARIKGASDLEYTVDAVYKAPAPAGMQNAIQLGTPFYLTLTGETTLGGFWDLDFARITLKSTAAGVSEKYWK